jgi:hypothetical protein
MQTLWIAALLACGLSGLPALAQNKVAEGEYEGRAVLDSGTTSARKASRWTLHGKGQGGYRLRSEILGPPDMQGRIFQTEELNEKLVPTMIGYEAYMKDHKKAIGDMGCTFANALATCHGRFDQGAFSCKPYKYVEPFWFWVDNLFAIDMPWLIGGAVNMAHLNEGKVPLSVVTLAGGGKDVECDLSSEEEGPLGFIASESLEVSGTKVAVKHYTFASGNKPMDLWITESGVLIKLSDADEGLVYVLVNYKQYKKLIPELPVEAVRKDTQKTK